MSTTVQLIIAGVPMGKQRPKAARIGKGVRVYTPQETLSYEAKIIHEYRQKYNEIIFAPHTELWVTIIAYFPITKQHYVHHKRTNTIDLDKDGVLMKEGKKNPLKKPDCDNIAKVCLDALNDVAYPDDSQITALLVIKKYSENPRVEITVERRGL